ncbi:sulfurtransferase complex subunit TusB [Vibrio aquaticus]|uniref:Sulfurtransferase complex subunit TusB n=1 Tax=Vibrio aquaticus TaxID=2496559 RepID=A0A432CS19_9VIBR|nr:sulfurtransferase complex subunit TusB [Vibrio aquaticus]RTZ13650.1 sulfurtransferase complex subunit TusB [Vibrio aquaticus]
MLHIVKTIQALPDVVSLFQADDALLLIEESVYAANPQHHVYRQIQGLNIAVLANDAKARGIENRISSNVVLVDYNGFVELTTNHANSMTWE